MRTARILWLILGMITLAAGAALATPSGKAAPPPASAPASDLSAAEIYKKDLPSIIFIDEKAKDGKEYIGSGFMAIKDGIAVTAWHMVHNAKSVTVRFPNGETFDVTGLVDHDAKNDVALIKVKVSGRPLLNLAGDEPEIGDKAYVIGTPLDEQYDFTITDGIISQIRHDPYLYQFTCPATHGDSGGPVLDSAGRVIGIVEGGVDQGPNIGFAEPAKYVLALDPTLPAKPWSDVVDDTPADKSDSSGSNTASNDALDQMIGTAFADYFDGFSYLNYVFAVMGQKYGYRAGAPPRLYAFQESLEQDIDDLSSVTSEDKDRDNLRADVLAEDQHVLDAIGYESLAIADAASNDGWDSEANDLNSRSVGAMEAVRGLNPDEIKLLLSVKSFRREYPTAFTDLHDSDSPRLGIPTMMLRDPLFVCSVDKGSVVDKLGIRAGDTILTVDGNKPESIANTFYYLWLDAGRKADIVVQRGDKQVELKADVPAKL